MDATLAFMKENLPPEEITLQAYIGLNWCGDKTLADVLEEAELAAELPAELVRTFLADKEGLAELFADMEGSAEELAAIEEMLGWLADQDSEEGQ